MSAIIPKSVWARRKKHVINWFISGHGVSVFVACCHTIRVTSSLRAMKMNQEIHAIYIGREIYIDFSLSLFLSLSPLSSYLRMYAKHASGTLSAIYPIAQHPPCQPLNRWVYSPVNSHCSTTCILPANTLAHSLEDHDNFRIVDLRKLSRSGGRYRLYTKSNNTFLAGSRFAIHIHMDATHCCFKMAKMLGDATQSRLDERAIRAQWRLLVRVIELCSHWRFPVWSAWRASKSLSLRRSADNSQTHYHMLARESFCRSLSLFFFLFYIRTGLL